MITFSKPGDPCTEFERCLLAGAEVPQIKDTGDQWVIVGKRIGADNLVIVLDEFSGMHAMNITSRRAFFAELYRPLRVERVLALRRDGLSGAEIAREMGISERTVDNDLRAAFTGTMRR
ncbi:MAG: sigma factor-like helix-turn-helix DNA-binding protein [Rudaea sp.]|nr:sigma factor-like helix-turn-helix DNA-binding protein [Rudaea sp.]